VQSTLSREVAKTGGRPKPRPRQCKARRSGQ